MKATVLVLLTAIVSPALAQFTPPLGAQPEVGGPRTEMMTLGTVHLSAHKGWKRAWLAPLNERLAAWSPGIVTIDGLSGAQCDAMRHAPQKYGQVFDRYCADAAAFQNVVQMSQPQAEMAAEALLRDWPETPTPAQRRRLAMLFLAAGDRPSAYVQWLRLPEAERREEDGLTSDAVDVFQRGSRPLNESYDLGSAVAAAAGLERVYSVDDHTSDIVGEGYPDGFVEWQTARFERIGATDALAKQDAATAAVADDIGLLALYRVINAPGAQDAQIRNDFGGAFADGSPEGFGRYYGGWWETRNLRMVANIREAITLHPGTRVLNIVGASHKPWYDQWARQMADVDVVEAADVLAD